MNGKSRRESAIRHTGMIADIRRPILDRMRRLSQLLCGRDVFLGGQKIGKVAIATKYRLWAAYSKRF